MLIIFIISLLYLTVPVHGVFARTPRQLRTREAFPGNSRIRIVRSWALASAVYTFIRRHVPSFIPPRLAIRRDRRIPIVTVRHRSSISFPGFSRAAHNRIFINMPALMTTLAFRERSQGRSRGFWHFDRSGTDFNREVRVRRIDQRGIV